MARKRRKGVVPPHLRPYLFKSGSRRKRRSRGASVAKRKRKSSGSRSGGSSPASLKEIMVHAGYGYFRQEVMNFASPVVAWFTPYVGQYATNVGLGLSAYAIQYFFKPSGLIRDGLKAVVLSEAFLVGSKAGRAEGLATTGSQSNTNSAWQ